MATYPTILSRTLLASVGGFLTFSALTAAQRSGMQNGGVTGTLALPGNVDRIYDGIDTLVVKTVDGANHVVRVDEDTKVHGGTEALAGLQRGTPVVVHYTTTGDQVSTDEIDLLGADGLESTEGTVAAVDRVHKTVTVESATAAAERLTLTHHAASEDTPAKGHRVIVYYTNESGQKVAHYFQRKS